MERMGDIEHHAQEFAPQGQSLYALKRERKDSAWTIAFCILAVVVFAGSFPAFTKTDKNLALYSSGFYNQSLTCDVNSFNAAAQMYYPMLLPNSSYTIESSTDSGEFSKAFTTMIATWLPVTAAVGIVLSAVYLMAFRKRPEAMVLISIIFNVGVTLGLGVLNLVVGAIPIGIILLVVGVILAATFYFIRDSLKVCARLMGVSGRALRDNGVLIPTSLAIKTVGVAVIMYYFAAFVCAMFVGGPQKASAVFATRPSRQTPEIGACYDGNGFTVPCCEWKQSMWAQVFAVFAFITFSWAAQIVLQIKLYVVADTTAQWYFMTPGAFSNSPERPSVGRAVRNAMTNSFGSIAFAGAILMVLRMLRSMARKQARNNIACAIINACIIQPLLALCEQFTRFATIAVAITGQTFYTSAKSIFSVLKRNFLQAYTLWWIPDFVLHSTASLFSLAWMSIVFLVTWLAYKDQGSGFAIGLAFVVSLVCFALMLYVLIFMASLLMDVVNTVYICFAMDRDNKRVTHPEIHAIYEALPTLQGAVVENPDGAVQYGRPDAAAVTPGAPMANPPMMQMAPMPPPPPYAGVAAYPAAQPVYGGYVDPAAAQQQAMLQGQGAYSAPAYGYAVINKP